MPGRPFLTAEVRITWMTHVPLICYSEICNVTLKVQRFFVFDAAAVITFDTVDEGSNYRLWGDLALCFWQRSGVQDAGIHPKATASRPGSVWPACVNFSSHCSAEHTETNDRMGGTVPTPGSTNGALSPQRTRRWCNVLRKLEHVFRIRSAAVVEANNRLWL